METRARRKPRAKARSSRPKCGARTRAGGKCNNPAGFKTGHPGEGRCFLHGSGTASHPGGRPIIHGLYAKVFRARAQQKIYEEALAAEKAEDLSGEIAAARALAARLIDMLPDGSSAAEKIKVQRLSEGIRQHLDCIGKNVERKARIEEGLKVKFEFEMNFKFIHAVISVLNDELEARIPDARTRDDISGAMAKKLELVAQSFGGAPQVAKEPVLPA